MRKEKFVYNTQTLRYEKVEVKRKERIKNFIGLACGVIVAAVGFTFLVWWLIPSPQEKILLKDIDVLTSRYEVMEQHFGEMSTMLTNLHDRDQYIHRMVLEMDPVDENLWEGGVGGHDKYADLRSLTNSGELIATLSSKVDKLKRQLVLQSKSLEAIEEVARKKEDMLASIPSIKPVREDKLARKVKLLSGFGHRLHPIYKVRKMHYGIDFTAPRKTPIQATGNGKVVRVERKGTGYGNNVMIDHGYGYKTLYGHMSRIDVTVGQQVKKGQQIGLVGNSGSSTAPHCHYEVHYRDNKVNPINYVMDGLSPEEYAELVKRSEVTNQSFD